jgi:ribonuclease G
VASELLIAAGPGELRGVLVEDGRAVDLRIVRDGEGGRVGEVHLGRVVRLLPALQAALVEIGLDRPAFLAIEDTAGAANRRLAEGDSVLVQITREAQGDKAASVSLRPRLAGRLLTLTPGRAGIVMPKQADPARRQRLASLLEGRLPDEVGAALGRAALAAAPDAVATEVAALQARWASLQQRAARATPPARLDDDAGLVGHLLAAFAEQPPERIVIDDRAILAATRSWLARHQPDLPRDLALHDGADDVFERHGVADDLAAATAIRVALAGGGEGAGALTVETTAAMNVIDVDGGDAVAGRGDPRMAVLGVNLAAAAAAARQIRLRNLAGAIVIDFISMERRGDRERVGATLQQALAGDPARPQILGWTRLGHVELTRRRRHRPLAEILFERPAGGVPVKSALTTALEALRAAARQALHQPARAPSLVVHPTVAAAFAGPAAAALSQFEAALARPVAIVSDPVRGRDTFDIRHD